MSHYQLKFFTLNFFQTTVVLYVHCNHCKHRQTDRQTHNTHICNVQLLKHFLCQTLYCLKLPRNCSTFHIAFILQRLYSCKCLGGRHTINTNKGDCNKPSVTAFGMHPWFNKCPKRNTTTS